MTPVLSVSSSRADVGILAPVWRALADNPQVDLHILLTGMHQAHDAPEVAGIPGRAVVHRGGTDLGGRADAVASGAMADMTRDAGQIIEKVQPHAMLVMGDRLDMLPAAVASLPFKLPLLHLHGGEVTEGAIDDRIRHALSQLADRHCVSSASAQERLLGMGIPADCIEITGASGLDTLMQAPELTAAEFHEMAGLPAELADVGRMRLVTVHPETASNTPLAPLEAVLDALDGLPGPTLFTAPNSDPGGAEARQRIEDFSAARPWAHFVDTLGIRLYANALRHAALMIGNSSSGVIEAGLFGLPVIDVGDRQKGRERGANVSSVPATAQAVADALDILGAQPDRFPGGSPYGDGLAGPRIADALVTLASGSGSTSFGSQAPADIPGKIAANA